MQQILKVRWWSSSFRLLIMGVVSLLAARVVAQRLSDLYTFLDSSGPGYPTAGLILSGDTLYGTAAGDVSVVFSVKTNSSNFSNLYRFYSPITPSGYRTYTPLLLKGNTLFGTTYQGIYTTNTGTIFALNVDGSAFTNLYTFSTNDGANLQSGLTSSGDTLYGTASGGGSSGSGTLFSIKTDGTDFAVLYAFTASVNGTNSDGFYPSTELVVLGDTIYGTASAGGPGGFGTIFSVHTNGSGFNLLHSFTASNTNSLGLYTNSEGVVPNPLIVSGNLLYGTATTGGLNGYGTVFAINTDGTGFTVLYTFTAGVDTGYAVFNSDGARPIGGLFLSGETLYGTTAEGGPWGTGTVFALNTNGTGFAVLHSFSQQVPPVWTNCDGATPLGSLIMSGRTLYGTASQGGAWGRGTIFSISLLPDLTIVPSTDHVVLSWPDNVGGFDYSGLILQSAPDFSPSSTWTNVSPAPVMINGQSIVTNPISGTQQFFRLVR